MNPYVIVKEVNGTPIKLQEGVSDGGIAGFGAIMAMFIGVIISLGFIYSSICVIIGSTLFLGGGVYIIVWVGRPQYIVYTEGGHRAIIFKTEDETLDQKRICNAVKEIEANVLEDISNATERVKRLTIISEKCK